MSILNKPKKVLFAFFNLLNAFYETFIYLKTKIVIWAKPGSLELSELEGLEVSLPVQEAEVDPEGFEA